MKSDWQKCLDRHSITLSSAAKDLVGKELLVAEKDLREAKDRLDHGSYKWSTIVSYYAMFHAARALLYSEGYKERSHYCLSIALHELFVKPGKMEASLNRAFINAMSLREDADYADEYSDEGAKEAYNKAEQFIEVAKKILE